MVRGAAVITVSIGFMAAAQRSSIPMQHPVVRYNSTQLACARFLEAADSKIQTEAGGQIRHQTSRRRGVWQFRATPVRGQVALEGWLDSLHLSRRSPETTITPDTDGLLGGRYRGTLSATGVYTSAVRPFVPDEIAEVAGMGTALDDLFPRLSPGVLDVGESWSDSVGLTVRRLPDSVLSGVSLLRFALYARGESRVAPTPSDTLPLKLRQVSKERGKFVWHPFLGLLRRERTIVVETTVPPSRTVRQAVRSKVEQRISLVRDLTVPPADPSRCRVASS